jgi:2-methylcitrate dehydratase PrpD
MTATAIELIGAHVSRGVRSGVTGELRQSLRLHVADTAAAWAAGARSEEGRALLEFAASLPQPPGVADQVMVRCAVTRLSEIDDIHLSSGTTPGAVVIPAALTLGAAQGASGEAIEEAILAGYEAMVKLGAAFDGPSVLYRGIWPTCFTAPFAVAAVASRLLELDERQAAHALALALVFSAPGVGHPAGPRIGRWLALGHAARHGCTAAFAARAGFTGDLQLLEKDFFRSIYAISPDLQKLACAPGARAALEGVSFKPWCAARQTIAAAQALKELVQGGVAVPDIQAIRVQVPPPYLKMINHGISPGDRSSYLTSAPYQVALSVIEPGLQFSVSPETGRTPAAVQELMSRVTVEADEALMRHFPGSWPACVRVSTASGEHEKLMLHVPGDPQRPFDERQVEDKFRRVAAPFAGAAAAQLWTSAVEATQAGGNARRLIAALEQVTRT